MVEAIRTEPAVSRAGFRMAVTAVILTALAAVAVWLVLDFVGRERARDLLIWQVRLGIVADSRRAAVEGWLDRQSAELAGVAGNPGLRLYATQWAMAGGDRSQLPDEAAQAGYLRNFLTVSAERAGFVAPPPGPGVSVTVGRESLAGLAVIDLAGQRLVATTGMPVIEGPLLAFVAAAERGRTAALGPYPGPGGRPSMAFLAPVYPVQGETSAAAQIGWVLGVKPVAGELYPLLRQPGAVEHSAETELVRRVDGRIEYLSPLLDGAPPLTRQLAADTPDLAEAFAIANPGGFGLRRDYRGEAVLVTGRPVTGSPGWVLVHKIDRNEAMADSDARLGQLTAVLLLAVALAAVALAGAWFYGASRRADRAASRYREIAERLDRNERFLRLVTDTQASAIFVFTEDLQLGFVNRHLAERSGASAGDLVGKPLALAIGPAAARRYQLLGEAARATGRAATDIQRADGDGTVRVSRGTVVPLPPGSEPAGGMLAVEEDITDVIKAREHRERTLKETVALLVTAVDRRDPNAGEHSRRVAALAETIAREMGLASELVETASIAGLLMNLGKILVPAELLTREGPLSGPEMRQVRDSILAGAELIQGIEFDGPVAETMRQMFERVDGTGEPRGLAGDDILVTARVIAVANAFVAMISPRAHRGRLGVDEAERTLLGQVGTAFDRGAVAALISHLDNKGGRAAFAAVAPDADP